MKDYCAREGLANSPLHTDQKNSSNQGRTEKKLALKESSAEVISK